MEQLKLAGRNGKHKFPRDFKTGFPNHGNQKVNPAKVLEAVHQNGSISAAARKLKIPISTAHQSLIKLKGTAEYERVIRPKLDELRLQLAAVSLDNAAKVEESLKQMPHGWDYIRAFATIVDKVKVLEPTGLPGQIGIRIDINTAEKTVRWQDRLKFAPSEVVVES